MAAIYPVIHFAGKQRLLRLLLPVLLVYAGCGPHHDNWAMYKADASSSSYSALRQINKENVHTLRPAWTFNPADAAPGVRFAFSECNPLEIEGVMYFTSARHRVYAISAASGEQLWS